MRVVVNATPLISLAFIDKLSLLDELFDEVYIPNAVLKEVTRKGKKRLLSLRLGVKKKYDMYRI